MSRASEPKERFIPREIFIDLVRGSFEQQITSVHARLEDLGWTSRVARVVASYRTKAVVVRPDGSFYEIDLSSGESERLAVEALSARAVKVRDRRKTEDAVAGFLSSGELDISAIPPLSYVSSVPTDTVEDRAVHSGSTTSAVPAWRADLDSLRRTDDCSDLLEPEANTVLFVHRLRDSLGSNRKSVLSALGSLVPVFSSVGERVRSIREEVPRVYGPDESTVVSFLRRLAGNLEADMVKRQRDAASARGSFDSLKRLYGALTADLAEVLTAARFLDRAAEAFSDHQEER